MDNTEVVLWLTDVCKLYDDERRYTDGEHEVDVGGKAHRVR